MSSAVLRASGTKEKRNTVNPQRKQNTLYRMVIRPTKSETGTRTNPPSDFYSPNDYPSIMVNAQMDSRALNQYKKSKYD